MPPNNPPLASVRAREAVVTIVASLQAAGLHPSDTLNRILRSSLATFERQLLDEIEARVRGLRHDLPTGSETYRHGYKDALFEALAAIQEVSHGRS